MTYSIFYLFDSDYLFLTIYTFSYLLTSIYSFNYLLIYLSLGGNEKIQSQRGCSIDWSNYHSRSADHNSGTLFSERFSPSSLDCIEEMFNEVYDFDIKSPSFKKYKGCPFIRCKWLLEFEIAWNKSVFFALLTRQTQMISYPC